MHSFDDFSITQLGASLGGAKVLAKPAQQTIPPPEVTSYYYFGGQRVAMRKGATVMWLHSDHLGSASLATDLNGIPVPGSETRYKPFGEIRYGSSGLPTDRRFTGYARERAGYVGSLDFAQARYYSPYLGRFISADSLVPRLGDPQSLNRYAFVRNSPLTRIDPSGHFDIPTWESVHDFLAGANYSLISANALAVSESDKHNLLAYTNPLGESRDNNVAYQAGQISGSVLAIVQGGFEIGGGIAAGGSGAAVCGTGVLCVAGAPMLAGGIALAGHGSAVAIGGAAQLGNDLPALFAKAQGHHISTNKNYIAGGQWSKKFDPLFKKAGLSLEGDYNIVNLPDHSGPHPSSYHQWVFDRLQKASAGLKGKELKLAMLRELASIKQILLDDPSIVNSGPYPN